MSQLLYSFIIMHKCLCTVVFLSHACQCFVHIADSLQHIQMDVLLLHLLLNNVHILNKMLDIKAGSEVVCENTRCGIVDLPAACSSFGDSGKHLLLIQSDRSCIYQCFTHRCHSACHGNLIAGLCMLTTPCFSHILNSRPQ